jgi:hypothetical protein
MALSHLGRYHILSLLHLEQVGLESRVVQSGVRVAKILQILGRSTIIMTWEGGARRSCSLELKPHYLGVGQSD